MKFIDFFSGIGGFRLGMEANGHTCVGHCEIDKYADASYRMMHTVTPEQREYILSITDDNPKTKKRKRLEEIRKDEYLNGEFYANDITRIRPEELPEADCYCFGFPCQTFSIAGRRKGFDDTRGTMFFEVMRLAKERKPKLLFAENVKGLLNHAGGTTFEVILQSLGELGYWFEWQVLNSKDFGVPQNRERIFIIGHLGNECGREVLPITRANEQNTIQQLGRLGGVQTR